MLGSVGHAAAGAEDSSNAPANIEQTTIRLLKLFISVTPFVPFWYLRILGVFWIRPCCLYSSRRIGQSDKNDDEPRDLAYHGEPREYWVVSAGLTCFVGCDISGYNR